jgi:hypothetical protein
MADFERRVEIAVYGRIGQRHRRTQSPAARFIIGQASRTETRMGGDAPFTRLRGAFSAP